MKKNTFIKRLASIALCMLIIIMAVPFVANAGEDASAVEQDWTGYTPISSVEDLDNIRKNLSGKYYLTCDIVFDENDFLPGGRYADGWQTIGDSKSPKNYFSGILDGNGYSISNFYITGTYVANDRVGIGLISTNSGTIRNLTVTDCEIVFIENVPQSVFNDGSGTGGIVGINNGIIENCTFGGAVSGMFDAGGICGYNFKTVKNCTNAGYVLAYSSAGGIAGTNYSQNGVITGCVNTGVVYQYGGSTNYGNTSGGICSVNKATGSVTGCANYGYVMGNRTGGIVGWMQGTSTLTDCFNTGMVYGSGSTGGICGYTENTIERCWNSGYIEGDDGKTGGITSYAKTVSYCFNLGDVYTYSSSGVGYTYASGIAAEVRSVIQCYNMGNIYADPAPGFYAFYGGMATEGITLSNLKSEYCYSLDISSNSIHDKTITKYYPIEKLFEKSTYVGFDFENTWFWDESLSIPQLRSNPFTYAEGIELENIPGKKIYLRGEEPDVSELRVYARYTSGVKAEVLDYYVELPDKSDVGLNTVIIDWYGLTEEFTVLMTGKDKFLIGDINYDGAVNSMDSYFISLMLANAVSTDEDMVMAADVNLDGSINAMDSYICKMCISGSAKLPE